MQKTDASLRESQKPVKVIKIVVEKGFYLIYVLGLILLGVSLFGFIMINIIDPHWLSIDSCLDDGKVWDYEQNICRDDCLTWQEEFGCIKLTKKQIEIFGKCGNSNLCPSLKTYKDVCLNNQKAWNLKSQKCKYNFGFNECFKLNGEWLYPEICSDKEKN